MSTTQTGVVTEQVQNGTLQRDDMDILTIGEAMITRIIAGSAINLSQTGGETGTGVVTINVTAGATIPSWRRLFMTMGA